MNGHDFSVDISDGFKDVEVELGILGEIPTENGATFIPSVSQDGIISWTNDKGLPNPAPVNIKGVTPHIGTNGNWFIGENDTGVPATGPASPPIPGGKAGQYLRKKSDADGDVEWADGGGAESVTINGQRPDATGNFIINTVSDVEIAQLNAALT